MNDSTTSVLESQPDWYTITAPPDPRADALRILGERLLLAENDRGNMSRDWTWRAYSGIHAGGVTWGVGQQGALLQVSGARAGDSFSEAYEVSPQVTRLDLQVTVRLPQYSATLAATYYGHLQSAMQGRRMPTTFTLLQGSDGGGTIYVGSPRSEQRARIYNKSVQSGSDAYRNCWRFEVQLRGDSARATAHDLPALPARSQYIADVVAGWCSQRGIRVPWVGSPRNLPIVHRGEQNDIDKKLAWLATQVRPAVEWLSLHGAGDRALAVLGLATETPDFPDFEVAPDA